MNVLFLSLLSINSLEEGNIYSDLLSVFASRGHKVYAVSPLERRYKQKTHIIEGENYKILRNKILNIQKTNLIEKGLSTLLIERNTLKAIKKHFKGVKFDLVLYSTPPVTFAGVVKYFKKRGAKTYLMLKDIFPQNCVDLGMFSKSSIFYKFFRRKEQKLYSLSDYIGCMSEANVNYLLEHNKRLSPERVEVFPNSEKLADNSLTLEEKAEVKKRYNLPQDKIIVCYGGNLGRPQNVDYLIECITKTQKRNFHYLIIGSGTHAKKVEELSKTANNLTYFSAMPKSEYLQVLASADVGLIVLDKRFTIPNFPSRCLSYLKAKLPVMCLTDEVCDMGDKAEDFGFGAKGISDSIDNFERLLLRFEDRTKNEQMGKRGYQYFCDHYDVEKTYPIIENKVKGENL